MASADVEKAEKIADDVRNVVRTAAHETAHAAQKLNAEAENRVNALLVEQRAGASK